MGFTLLLKNVGINDLHRVGGKNASLGEMLQNLTNLGVNIPDGFVVTVAAYKAFLKHNSLDKTVTETVDAIDYDDIESLRRGGMHIRQAFLNGKFPEAMSIEIAERYEKLSQQYGQEMTDVAVRSSATAEDLPDASFAGQQESYLNVRGAQTLMDSIRKCFASLFTDRAISYRHRFGYDLLELGLSVCVQKMVRSDLGTSGVAFSIDTESGFKDAVVINGTYGLGEMLVQGAISPDEFIVFKPLLKEGYESVIEKKLGNKDKMMIYGEGGDERVKIIPTEEKFRSRFCLDQHNVIKLAQWVVIIEDYYTKIRDKWTPMDVEWAIDGLTKELFIVQARPETIHSQKEQITTITEYIMEDETRHEKIITKGVAVGDKIGSGKANIIFSMDKRVTEGHVFTPGSVLVTEMTDPDWEPIMKMASAIITNKGGRTCHAAIIAREMGIPAIVGCGNATEVIKEGMMVTASCAEGDKGYVYEGEVNYTEKEHDLSLLPKVKTDIMLNVASPGMAFQFSHLPNKGVGLAREEFIINNYIEVHPLALMNHRKLNDAELTAEIEKKITGYPDEETFFIDKLADGVAKIAASFYPNKTIVRFSDFKTNEYYNLLGGKYYEPKEENPMIGWRGASRYYSEAYKEAFGLECRAIKKVREEMGLKNVTVMIPFCRTVEELLRVTEVMKEYGLVRGEHELELFLMAEVPSNILMAAEFAEHIDGFSIGSNDLTQLTLGLDRDSSLVAHLYDERNPAVKRMLEMLITTAKKAGVKVGICGQGPSDFPDFAQFLVSLGIDSISVTPDSVIKTVTAIAEAEQLIAEKEMTKA
ncbi:phosphoenolpyruvate synthase [Flavobacterium arcticum]|uniref:Phosphoenolpyruvate synthase n=1 Tax=Flavobacterium arcticum TaxID=1784713 RepID=A0A345H905_9FLAO|nr:phosphoenolpyruvate synthase [Flavobacterium arcticum]AXG73065.1 phosphoenolpyruvate synthase [Flavobacterium arcticum]KAF2512857.1 phosphoenolpyruvate synthase [Flavobacterium arcticum]